MERLGSGSAPARLRPSTPARALGLRNDAPLPLLPPPPPFSSRPPLSSRPPISSRPPVRPLSLRPPVRRRAAQAVIPVWRPVVCGDGTCDHPYEFPAYGPFGCVVDCGLDQSVTKMARALMESRIICESFRRTVRNRRLSLTGGTVRHRPSPSVTVRHSPRPRHCATHAKPDRRRPRASHRRPPRPLCPRPPAVHGADWGVLRGATSAGSGLIPCTLRRRCVEEFK